MYQSFNSMPGHSRLWIYQANRFFSPQESKQLEEGLKKLCDQWSAHQVPLSTSYTIQHKLFAILAVDENQMVKVRIIDTGMGMTPDELKGLFQQFHQVDGSPTRRAGGTGLGLAITKQLVEAQGGVISARNLDGGGLQIQILLKTHL